MGDEKSPGRGLIARSKSLSVELDKPQYLTLLNAIATNSLPGLVIQALLQYPEDPYVLIKSLEAIQCLCQHNPALLDEFLLLGTFEILREALLAHIQVKEVLLVIFRLLQTVCESSPVARSTCESGLLVTALQQHPEDHELHLAGLQCLSVLLNGDAGEYMPPFIDPGMIELYLRVLKTFPQSTDLLRLAILGLGHAFNTSQRWALFQDRVPELVSATIKQCEDKSLMDLYHPVSSVHLALDHPQFGESDESFKVLDFIVDIDEYGVEGEPLLSAVAARAAAGGSERDFTLLELLVACGASLDKFSPLKSVRQLYCQRATRHNRVREAIGRGLDREAKSRASLSVLLASQTNLPQPLMNIVAAYIGTFTHTPFIRSLFFDWDCPSCTFRVRKPRPKSRERNTAPSPARTVCSCCQTELVGFVDPEARSKNPRWDALLNPNSCKVQHEAAEAWLAMSRLDQEAEGPDQPTIGDSWDVEFSGSLDRGLFYPDSVEFARVLFESMNRKPGPDIVMDDGSGDEAEENDILTRMSLKWDALEAEHKKNQAMDLSQQEAEAKDEDDEDDPDAEVRQWALEKFPTLAVEDKSYTREQLVEVATSQLPLTVLSEVGENQWRSARTVGIYSTGVHLIEFHIDASPKAENSWGICVGLVTPSFRPDSIVGQDVAQEGWGYLGGTGEVIRKGNVARFGKPFGPGHAVAMLLNFEDSTVEVFLNGQSQGVAFRTLRGPVHGAVSTFAAGTQVSICKPSRSLMERVRRIRQERLNRWATLCSPEYHSLQHLYGPACNSWDAKLAVSDGHRKFVHFPPTRNFIPLSNDSNASSSSSGSSSSGSSSSGGGSSSSGSSSSGSINDSSDSSNIPNESKAKDENISASVPSVPLVASLDKDRSSIIQGNHSLSNSSSEKSLPTLVECTASWPSFKIIRSVFGSEEKDNIFAFQIAVRGLPRGSSLSIGLVSRNFNTAGLDASNNFLGSAESVGYMSKGECCAPGTGGSPIKYGDSFQEGDRVSVVANLEQKTVQFWKNDSPQGVLALGIEPPLYAAIALLSEGTKLELESVDLRRLEMLQARSLMIKEVERSNLNAWDPTKITVRFASEHEGTRLPSMLKLLQNPSGLTTQVEYKGHTDCSLDHEWASCGSLLPYSGGRRYFEVRIEKNSWDACIGIVPLDFSWRAGHNPANGFVGIGPSWGLCLSHWSIRHGGVDAPISMEPPKTMEQLRVGVLMDFDAKTIDFTVNGRIARSKSLTGLSGPVYAAVSLAGRGTCLTFDAGVENIPGVQAEYFLYRA